MMSFDDDDDDNNGDDILFTTSVLYFNAKDSSYWALSIHGFLFLHSLLIKYIVHLHVFQKSS